MKKLTALISALALLLSLCACSGQSGSTKSAGLSPEPGAASQAVNEDQNNESVKEPPVTPVVETNAPKSSEEPQPSADAPEISAPAPDPAPTPEPAPAPDPAPKPEQAPDPEPVPVSDPKTTAQGLIGHPVSELYAAIGQPISSDYAPGCLEPDSEDGELIYNGFTVYTVRTATREYVYDVL